MWSANEDDAFHAVLAKVYETAQTVRVAWEDPYLGELTDVLFLARLG